MESLISADNTWVLWAILVGDAALAIWLEQRYKWASKVTGCVLALLCMMILSNIESFQLLPRFMTVYGTMLFLWQSLFFCSSATSRKSEKRAASC